jgi:hypothetical protein
MRRLVLLLPLAAIALTGCSATDSGPQTSQNRDVPAFTRVDNDGSVHVRAHIGEPRRVRVTAGEKVIDDVSTEVRDGTLHVRFDHHGWRTPDTEVEVWTPRLAAITSDGSGDVDVDGVRADAFEVRADGSADIRVAGTADQLTVATDGSGDAELADLKATSARVKASGSGDVEVRATHRLDANAEGAGDVRYHGAPRLTEHADGAGDIKRAG